MKKQITRVSPVQTAKVSAILYFVLSIPLVAFMALSMTFSPAPGPGLGFLLIFPVLYLVGGFIITALSALVYNLVASWVGGIEYTSTTVEGSE